VWEDAIYLRVFLCKKSTPKSKAQKHELDESTHDFIKELMVEKTFSECHKANEYSNQWRRSQPNPHTGNTCFDKHD
jgi:hypothetical protein